MQEPGTFFKHKGKIKKGFFIFFAQKKFIIFQDKDQLSLFIQPKNCFLFAQKAKLFK